MTKDHPGIVFCRKEVESDEVMVKIFKKNVNTVDKTKIPSKLLPDGFTDARKECLFHKIRKFCKPDCKDLIAPNNTLYDYKPHFLC